jgi:hypothetical protein
MPVETLDGVERLGIEGCLAERPSDVGAGLKKLLIG